MITYTITNADLFNKNINVLDLEDLVVNESNITGSIFILFKDETIFHCISKESFLLNEFEKEYGFTLKIA